MEAPWHRRFPDGRRLTLTARFLAISARVGAFSTSRSDLELDESVEDPEAVDACFILLSDSLLSGQFGAWIIHTNVDWNRFRNLCVTELQSLLSAYTEIVHVINHGVTCGK